jgi:hypothetical protein
MMVFARYEKWHVHAFEQLFGGASTRVLAEIELPRPEADCVLPHNANWRHCLRKRNMVNR